MVGKLVERGTVARTREGYVASLARALLSIPDDSSDSRKREGVIRVTGDIETEPETVPIKERETSVWDDDRGYGPEEDAMADEPLTIAGAERS
jgi:hypothetical protein